LKHSRMCPTTSTTSAIRANDERFGFLPMS